MLRKMILVLIGGLALVLSITSTALADRRSYVWTYEYQTMPKGEMEVEFYNTTEVPDASNSKVNTWKPWVELEYGVTDHLDVSMYQQFKQTNGASSSSFEYDGFKLRTRYRLGEKGMYFVDPLLYLEYIRNDNLRNPNVLEGKVILAKDFFDRFNYSYNQIIKQELTTGATPTEHEYATGLSYEFSPQVKLGLESKGNYTSDKYYIGPTVSFASQKVWMSFGTAWGVSRKADDIQARMIIGVPL